MECCRVVTNLLRRGSLLLVRVVVQKWFVAEAREDMSEPTGQDSGAEAMDVGFEAGEAVEAAGTEEAGTEEAVGTGTIDDPIVLQYQSFNSCCIQKTKSSCFCSMLLIVVVRKKEPT